MEKRFASIEIGGKEYPLNFSVRASQNFYDVTAEKASTEPEVYKRNIKMLSVMLRDAAEYKERFLGEAVEDVPTVDDLELLLNPGDNNRVIAAINEAVELGGMRLVKAESSKKKDKESTAPAKKQ